MTFHCFVDCKLWLPIQKVLENVCTKRIYARCLSWWCKNAKWRQWRWRIRLNCPSGGTAWSSGRGWNASTIDGTRGHSRLAYTTGTALSVVWRLKHFCSRPAVPLACCSNWGGDIGRHGGERAYCFAHRPTWSVWSLDRTTRRRTMGSFWAFGWGFPSNASGATHGCETDKRGKSKCMR